MNTDAKSAGPGGLHLIYSSSRTQDVRRARTDRLTAALTKAGVALQASVGRRQAIEHLQMCGIPAWVAQRVLIQPSRRRRSDNNGYPARADPGSGGELAATRPAPAQVRRPDLRLVAPVGGGNDGLPPPLTS